MSLDEDDSDVRRFLTDVVAALRTTNPDLGAEALALLAAERGPATEDVL